MPGNWKTRSHHADQATQRSATSFALLVAIAVWCANEFGITRVPETMALDAVVAVRNSIAPPEARVLLVELPASQNTSLPKTAWLQLTGCLPQFRSWGATAFVVPASLVDSHNTANAASLPDDVFLSLTGYADKTRAGLYRVEPIKTHDMDANRCGITSLGTPINGVHRTQQTGYFDGFHRYPAIETLVADYVRPETSAFTEPSYRVNFRGDSGSLPTIAWHRLQNRDVVQDLVEHRVVIFGFADSADQRGLQTPTTNQAAGMSMLEYQGHALNTLLTDTVVRPLPRSLQLVLLIVVAFVAFVIGRMLRFSLAFVILSGLTVGTIATAIVLLDSLAYSLPLVSMAVCGVIGLLRACELRQQLTTAMTSRMLADLSRRIGRRDVAAVFKEADPWPQIATLFDQALPIQGMVFFEATHQSLVAKHSVRCDVDKHAVQQLSTTTTPFTTAYSVRRPLNLSSISQTIPCSVNTDAIQYLIPLATASDLLGFALIVVEESTAAELSDIQHLLNDFSLEVTNLLAERAKYRQIVRSNPNNRWSVLASLQGFTPERLHFQKLKLESEQLNTELSQYERLFHDSDHPTIVFDIFGDVLLTNSSMGRLLSVDSGEASLQKLSDFLPAVASISTEECQTLLRNVMIRRCEETLSVTWNKRNWLIRIRPLLADHSRIRRTKSPTVFSTEALIVELLDQTRFELLTDMRLAEAEQTIEHLRDQLTNLSQTSRVPESELAGTQQTHEFLHDHLDTGVAVLQKSAFGKVVNEVTDANRFGPCDIRFPLELAADSVSNQCHLRSIRIAIDRPKTIGRVFGNPAYLKRFFTGCLNLALTDARDTTVLSADVTVDEEFVHIAFQSDGPGQTNEDLRSRLENECAADPEYSEFRECCRWLEQWGGKIVANGVIGQGLKIQTSFRRFD